MTKSYFFTIIDKRDNDKFQNFKFNNFKNSEKTILQKHHSDSFWGFHSGSIQQKIWNKIQKNDIMFLTTPTDSFEIYGTVSHKIINSKIGKNIWPDEINSNQINHFLFFKKINKFNLSYHELIGYSDRVVKVPIPGIYEIKNTFKKIIENKFKNQPLLSTTNQLRPKETNYAKISKIVPIKYKTEVFHYARDPPLVKTLKKLYDNRCQICDFTFEYKKGKFYSEAHHYNPISKQGKNDWTNLIIVCPNHHAQFDYNIIAIANDGNNIIDRNGDKIGKIIFHKQHSLRLENITSQLV